MRISYSGLELYQACPYLFKYTVIDKHKLPKSKEAAFGTSVHEALKFMFSPNPLYPAFNEVIDFFKASWSRRSSKIEFRSDEEKNGMAARGGSMLEKFYKKNPPWNFNVLDLESRFDVELVDSESGETHNLVGIIDRIDKLDDDNYEIIDYKTSKRMPSQERLDRNLQLSLYNLGLIKRWPHLERKKVRLSLYFMPFGESLATYRTLDDLNSTKEKIVSIIREIKDRGQRNDWPAYDSPLCAIFPYRTVCPMWKHLYKAENGDPNEAEIQKILAEFLELKFKNQENNSRLRGLQQALAGYMRQTGLGRLFGESGYITRAIKAYPIYDRSKLKEAILELREREIITARRKKL